MLIQNFRVSSTVYPKIMSRLKSRIKFTNFSRLLFRIIIRLSISFTLAIITSLNFVKDSSEIQQSIRKGLPPLHEWYYQKIYYSSKSIMDMNQPFVDNIQFSSRGIEILNFGDLFYRILFKLLFPNEISFAYFVSTIILLTLWIYFISVLILSVGKTNFMVSATITTVFIVLFFGNSRLPNNEYPFARIMSPQFVGLIWVLATVLVLKATNNESRLAKSKVLLFFSFSILVFFASFTYLYLLLSILGTLMALILNYLRTRIFGKALILTSASLIGSTPYLLSNLQKIDEARFIEAGLRMGLVESRAPGGGLTIILSFLCFFVLKSSKITKFNSQDSIKKTLNFSTLGILIASLSNFFTNISIQFSYHFEIFILLNCLMILSLILKKLIDQVFFDIQLIANKMIFITIILTFLPSVYFTSREFKSSERDLLEIQQIMEVKFGDNSNLIVDVKGLQNTLRVYSKSRIFYQEDMIPYGYTNNEILERYFISAGCSDNLTNNSLLSPLAYYIEASKQKGESLQKYLSLMNLESRFSYFYKPLLDIARSRNESAIEFIKDLKIKLQPSNCLESAQQKDIDFIIFDQNSNWSEILENKSIVKSNLGIEGIFYARI